MRTQYQCSVDGCVSKAHSKHLCNKHLHRLRATGNPNSTQSGTVDDPAERLKLKSKAGANGCIEWTGFVGHEGYGHTSFKGKTIGAHRLAWIAAHGDIPEGLFVCHRCDNRLCINTEHLFLGTPQDNTQDAISKGRIDPAELGRTRWRKACQL